MSFGCVYDFDRFGFGSYSEVMPLFTCEMIILPWASDAALARGDKIVAVEASIAERDCSFGIVGVLLVSVASVLLWLIFVAVWKLTMS